MPHRSIFKKTASNGLTTLVVPLHKTPKVSVQLWYNVGSKHERSGEKGIAHFIEHMIFKGTDKLSESDINEITHKLSGVCNAFTSHDFTGYLFDFPTHNWHEALPIMADCMRGCTFEQEYLHSELKAVVQELKMYRDDYVSTALEQMMSSIFSDHPYRYPVIGYKQDLWNLQRDQLVAFYQRHYIPNNAALIVVGDVDPEDVFARVEREFGHIPPDLSYAQPTFYHAEGIDSMSLTLYREVQQPTGLLAWEIPGVKARRDYQLDLASWILGSGKGARLYRKLVDELGLATDVESFTYDLFEHGLFVVIFDPAEGVHPDAVRDALLEEVELIRRDGFSEAELQRGIRKTAVDFIGLQEQHQKYAYLVGKYFTALGDENYCMRYTEESTSPHLADNVHELITTYLRPAVGNYGVVAPVPAGEKDYWVAYQEASDREDERILSGITRSAEVKQGVHVVNVVSATPKVFDFPHAHKMVLDNGLTVLLHQDDSVPTIDVVIELPTKHYYDPEDKQGLSMLLIDVMQEGTKKRSAVQFSDELEGLGMSLEAVPGMISLRMLSADFERGMSLLMEMITEPALHDGPINKIRERLLADVRIFWDSATKCAAQLMRQAIYQKHPYHRATLGTPQSLSAITSDDVRAAHHAWITPQGTIVAIVGDFRKYSDFPNLVRSLFESWSGPKVAELVFPAVVVQNPPPLIKHQLQRDQIVLAFGRPSVSRMDPDFDALLLFDQIFTGGVLRSMSSRLFELRERSGLFYSIGGSLVAGSGKQPGLVYISTIVSPDRLEEAERAIRQTIEVGAQTVTEEELHEAAAAVEASIVDLFSSNRQAAAAFTFLEEYKLPEDYFARRTEQLRAVSLEKVKQATAKVLDVRTLAMALVGRIK